MRKARIAVLPLVVILTLALTGGVGSGHGGAQPGVVPTAELTVRPNIVVFLTDDQTMEAFRRMPYVNSRTDWVTFDNAWINNALCCPSRATILSGQYDTHTNVLTNIQGWRFDAEETIGTWLQRRGYRTGLIGKYLNGIGDPSKVPPGWDDFQAVWPGPAGYTQYGYTMNVNGRQVRFGSTPGDYQVDVLTAKARRFIQTSVAAGRPFLLVFTPTATHGPYVAGPGERGMFARATVPALPGFNEDDVSDKPRYVRNLPLVSPAEMAQKRRDQWEASVSVDDAMRALDAQLRASGVAGDTAVIFLTDNGFSFGVHRWSYKMCQYAACSRTPLLVRYPGATPHRVGRYASNVDVASTVAAMAGATPGIPQDGRSLLPLVLGRAVSGWPTAVLQHWPGGDSTGAAGHGPAVPAYWAVRAQLGGTSYAYVELGTGERELYDLAVDPHELRNVAGRPAYTSVQARLAEKLATMRSSATSARAVHHLRPPS